MAVKGQVIVQGDGKDQGPGEVLASVKGRGVAPVPYKGSGLKPSEHCQVPKVSARARSTRSDDHGQRTLTLEHLFGGDRKDVLCAHVVRGVATLAGFFCGTSLNLSQLEPCMYVCM